MSPPEDPNGDPDPIQPRRRPISRHRAESVWLEAIEQAKARREQRLPTVRAMTARTGLAHATLARALRDLGSRGLVRLSPRSGTWLAPTGEPLPGGIPTSSNAPAEELRPKWRWLTEQLRADVYSGSYKGGTLLPTLKELGNRYGACHATLRQATDALCASGLLRPNRRGLQVVPESVQSGRTEILLVLKGDASGRPEPINQRSWEFMASLERLCAARELRLRMALYVDHPEPELAWKQFQERLERVLRERAVAGAVSMGSNIEPANVLYNHLCRRGFPVALIDEWRNVQGPRVERLKARWRTFAIDYSATPGEKMARHLLDLGHRRVAYLGFFHKDVWSINRLRGLKEIFALAGHPDAIQDFSLDSGAGVSALCPAGKILSGAEAVRHRLEPGVRALRELHDGEFRYPTAGDFDVHLEKQLRRVTIDTARRLALEPVLEELLVKREVTALVAENDLTALLILDYLRVRRVPMPAGLSLAGFDNSREGHSLDLTSYDFNMQALVESALAFLIRPSGAGGNASGQEGFVIRRGTTGPAAF